MIRHAAVGLLMCSWGGLSCAEENEVLQGRDKSPGDQIQDMKTEVLEISGKLIRLEEQLLYPAKSRVTVFLLFGPNVKFPPGSVSLKIDGEPAVDHKYTQDELAALLRGGAQRIYTGNIRDGEHSIEVEFVGNSTRNNDDHEYAAYKFSKAAGAKLIEITLTGRALGSQSISFRE